MAEEDILAKLLEQLLAADEKGSSQPEKHSEDEKNCDGADGLFGNIDLDAIFKLGELFSQMNKPDKNTQLLLALKPHLRPENQHKVDNALRMMKIMSLLPILKETGLLNGFLGL